jgi:hypothetical protein
VSAYAIYEDGIYSVPKRRHKIQNPEDQPKEKTQNTKHDESFNLRIFKLILTGVAFRHKAVL